MPDTSSVSSSKERLEDGVSSLAEGRGLSASVEKLSGTNMVNIVFFVLFKIFLKFKLN